MTLKYSLFLPLFLYSHVLFSQPQGDPAPMKLNYPQTKKVNQVDDYFGTLVEDPYRWLENDTASDTKAWVIEENNITQEYLSAIPYREKIKNRLTGIFNYPKYSIPYRIGDYYFFEKNNGLENQAKIYFQKGISGAPQLFIDPNLLTTDGTASITVLGHSKNNKYLACSVNRSGSDWQEIRIYEISTSRQLEDKLEWVKFSGAAWKDNGFYYSRYDKPVQGKEFSNKNEFHKIYYHKLGEKQENDVLIFEDKSHPLRYFGGQTTEDEKFLIIDASEGTSGTQLYCQNLSNSQKDFTVLFKGFENNANLITNVGDKILIRTDAGAPNQKVVLIDPANPAKENWKEIIPEKTEFLEAATTGGNKIFARYLKNATSRIYQYDYSGKPENEIILPGLGTAAGFEGNEDDAFIFYNFSSFNFPPSIYKYNLTTHASDLFRKSEVTFNPSEYITKQVFYPGKDGTEIPMFIVHKKDIKLDGKNPLLLYAYGGFNVSLTPSFSASRIVLLENGGIFAMPNLRGGGEFGEQWHEAGRLLNKQNVFDDFISAAEYLISEKYTSTEKLAIQGGSNGGLLIGACMTQRPELFKVAFPQVGVLDMLRYHKFTIGWGWVVEYGSSDSSLYFPYLYNYSPLHNLKSGIDYPATLITTGDHDDRVVPAHSFKFAATLQEKNNGTNPTLIRIETKAGHGAGKPISKIIDEHADMWSFMFYNLDVKPIY